MIGRKKDTRTIWKIKIDVGIINYKELIEMASNQLEWRIEAVNESLNRKKFRSLGQFNLPIFGI